MSLSTATALRSDAKAWRRVRAFSALLAVMIACHGCGEEGGNGKRDMSFDEEAAAIQQEPQANVRAKELTKLAFRRHKAQDKAGAERTLFSAQEACKAIADASSRADALGLLAEAQARMDDKSSARRTLAAARQVVDQIAEPEPQALALAALACAQAAAGDSEAASATLKDAEKHAAGLKDYQGKPNFYGQALTLAKTAEGYQRLGQQAEAERVVTEAVKQALACTLDRERCTALAEVSLSQGRMKQADAAAKTLEMALAEARKIEKLHSRTHVLAELGEILVRTGQMEKGRKLLDEADQIAAKIPEPDLRQQAQDKVRQLLNKLPPTGS